LVDGEDKAFYRALNNGIWHYFIKEFSLKGHQINKEFLTLLLKQSGINEEVLLNLSMLFDETETGSYTTAKMSVQKDELLHHAKQVLYEIDAALG
jgi:hypothetical protein